MDILEICLAITSIFVSQVYSKGNVTKCYYKNNIDTPYYILEIGDGTIHELPCVDSCQCNNINSYTDLTGIDGCWSCCCGPVYKAPQVEDGEKKDWIGTTIFGILFFGLVAANLLYFGYRYYRHRTTQDVERGVIETDEFQNNSPRASIHYAILSENDIEDDANKSQSNSASQQILNEKKKNNRFFRSFSNPP